MNRDIIRSHNEVMMVIGVAEPENPANRPEHDIQRQHELREDPIAQRLALLAKRCIEGIGILGVNGLRDRILVYKRYSEIPFWELFRQARRDFSVTRDILPGAPASFLHMFVESYDNPLGPRKRDGSFARRCIDEARSYLEIHLELFVAMQRLGLISRSQWLPRPSFFIPFTSSSPIIRPPPLHGFDLQSIAQWCGGLLISTTPFLVWFMTQRLIKDWRPQIWRKINSRLPTTDYLGKLIPPSLRSPRLQPAAAPCPVEDHALPPPATDGDPANGAGPAEITRRPSIVSHRDDDYASDEEMDGIRATLISFDVEATESSADAPQGLWSAELRPSVTHDSRLAMGASPVYCDMLLTQIPVLIAARIFADTATRVLIAPYEGTSLRLIARACRRRAGLACWDILPINVLAGMNWTLAINYLGVELLQLVLSSGVWAVGTVVSERYHMSEEEFKALYQKELEQANQQN
ncbi:hypothetical protein ESCO_000507 [Escovopsis weberi]|uniref:Uncharacterized protein n=1 Tax=Escovopsis weberi TaxID=150374 RepID=A0A0M8N3B6_ESCWE|nr:hypothetical protein ESCO_000507 [Escovopsis weberi]